jgi:hypothetical protein
VEFVEAAYPITGRGATTDIIAGSAGLGMGVEADTVLQASVAITAADDGGVGVLFRLPQGKYASLMATVLLRV